VKCDHNLLEMSESINIEKNGNCLNTVRLLAAFQVLYGHAVTHLETGALPFLHEFIMFFDGVPIFFTMSGFLIWFSAGRSSGYGDFLKKRFWRIYPELWLAVLVELAVLIALYSEPIVWPQLGVFAITQGTIFQFWTPDSLRGYGCGCPNGALWTICVLVQFYIIVYFIYKCLHNRKLWVWFAAIAASIGAGIAIPSIQASVPGTAGKLLGQTVIPYLWMFLCASFAAEKKDLLIPVLKKTWWAFVSVLLVDKYLIHFDIVVSYPILKTLLLFLGLVGFAYSFPRLNIKTDISYGIYIYHMTVVNALLTLGYSHNYWLLLFVAACTSLLAWVSTKTVGEWTKRMKSKKTTLSL